MFSCVFIYVYKLLHVLRKLRAEWIFFQIPKQKSQMYWVNINYFKILIPQTNFETCTNRNFDIFSFSKFWLTIARILRFQERSRFSIIERHFERTVYFIFLKYEQNGHFSRFPSKRHKSIGWILIVSKFSSLEEILKLVWIAISIFFLYPNFDWQSPGLSDFRKARFPIITRHFDETVCFIFLLILDYVYNPKEARLRKAMREQSRELSRQTILQTAIASAAGNTSVGGPGCGGNGVSESISPSSATGSTNFLNHPLNCSAPVVNGSSVAAATVSSLPGSPSFNTGNRIINPWFPTSHGPVSNHLKPILSPRVSFIRFSSLRTQKSWFPRQFLYKFNFDDLFLESTKFNHIFWYDDQILTIFENVIRFFSVLLRFFFFIEISITRITSHS